MLLDIAMPTLAHRYLPLLALLLLACSPDPQSPPPHAATTKAAAINSPQQTESIDWIEGDIDEALVRARDSGQPLLLYWGAKWCPPCNALQARVFPRPEFIAQTRQFVAVHLDGDTPGAQQWGEQFGVIGYPTLVILRADGSELMRIAGTTDIEEFPRVLALAARQNQSLAELVELALASTRQLSADDWLLLTHYGWSVDTGSTLKRPVDASLLLQLAERCPEPAAAQRFALLAALHQLDDGSASSWDQARRQQLRQLLTAILAEPAQVRSNLSELIAQGPALLAAITSNAERPALISAFIQAMALIYSDEQLSISERLQANQPLIALARLDGQPLPATLVEQIRQRVAWADGAATTPQQRQDMVYHGGELLAEVGLVAEAEQLLTAELPRARAPYYHMSGLARLAEQRGDIEAALDWMRQARDAAEGPATRSQWAVSYISGLLRLAPNDRQAIENASAALLAELALTPAGYYQRTRSRLTRLGGELQQWAQTEERQAVVSRLKLSMTAICSQLPAPSDARHQCERWPQ